MKKIFWILSITLYTITLGSSLLSIVFDVGMLPMVASIVSFLAFWMVCFISQFKNKLFLSELPQIFENSKAMPRIARVLFLMLILLFFGFFVIGWSLFAYYGGGPEICEEGFCIVNHGHFVTSITANEYDILDFLDRFLFTAILLVFLSTWVAHSYAKFKEELEYKRLTRVDPSNVLKPGE